MKKREQMAWGLAISFFICWAANLVQLILLTNKLNKAEKIHTKTVEACADAWLKCGDENIPLQD